MPSVCLLIRTWEISIKSYKIIFKLILVTNGCDISSEFTLRWTSLDLSDDNSTLVQVMAWCHQATSQYLNQCWPRSLPPYGITRPQWVKILSKVSSAEHLQKYANVAWSIIIYFGYVLADFIHIFQGYFSGIGTDIYDMTIISDTIDPGPMK